MCLPSSAASSGTPAIAVATASRSSNRAPQESLTAGFVQGVADALVGAAGLAVDAVGVDLEQDGDTVAARRGHGCFKIVLGPALAVPGLPGRDVVPPSGIGSADLIMK